MSIVGRIARGTSIRAAAGDVTVTPGDTSWLRDSIIDGGSSSGTTVTADTALGLDSVWASVRLLSDAIGALPLKVYQRRRGGGRQEAFFEDIYRVLHDRPNPEMTPADAWGLVVTHLNLWGNGYLGKVFTGSKLTELWPIRPDLMRVARQGGEKVFYLRDADTGREGRTPLTMREVIHIRGLSLDGFIGLSPVRYHRETVGGGLAQDRFANGFYGNSAVPRGVLEVDGELSDDATARLRREWNAIHRGAPNAHKLAILEGGTTFKPITMPLEDAQYVEQQKLTVQKIARVFRVPPSMIGGSSGDPLTYTTVEGEGLHFERYSVRPWIVRIEQALAGDADLFPASSLYPEFSVDALLRADAKTRAEVYSLGLDPQKGWLNRGEVRDLENLPPEDAASLPAPPAPPAAIAARMAEIVAAAQHSRNGGHHHDAA